MILNDSEIEALCYNKAYPMIEPFYSTQITSRAKIGETPGIAEYEKVISYGLTSFGYDIRCGRKFKIFTNVNSTVIDPKNFDDKCFVEFEGDVCIIPPNSFVLAHSLEYIRVPRDMHVICLNKSTYARTGVMGNCTPLEAGWEGHITLEFSNTTPLPAKLYAEEGCVQLNFFRGNPCSVSYADRGGKYMHQGAEPVTPRLK